MCVNLCTITTVSLRQNLQPTVCKSEAGDKGICMFAVDCIKMNGVSLGACVHLFYFGSCCALRSPSTTTQSAHFVGSVPGNSSSPLLTLATTTPSTTTSSSLITQTTDSGLKIKETKRISTQSNFSFVYYYF